MGQITIWLPEDLEQRIERERGDVARSKYILRLIQKAYAVTPVKSPVRQRNVVEKAMTESFKAADEFKKSGGLKKNVITK
jgi:hypothetical protein